LSYRGKFAGERCHQDGDSGRGKMGRQDFSESQLAGYDKS